MQSTSTPSAAPGRRDLLAGLGLAAAAPLLLGSTARSASPQDPSGRPAPNGGAVLLRGASLVLTMDRAAGSGGPLGALENADVLMRSGAVAAVGPSLPRPPGTRVVEAAGKVVMPGFVDTHTHLWQAAIRGGCTDRDLFGWFAGCTHPQRGRLTPEAVHSLVRLAALDAVQSGVTTLVDWVDIFAFDLVESYLRALAGTGVRFTYAMYPPRPDGVLVAKVKKELVDPVPLGSFQVATHAARSVQDLNRAHWELARDLGVMLNSHVLERPEQRADDPVGVLADIGALGPRLLINHAVHLTDAEIARLAEHDVRAAHCPLSNMRLASGIMRLSECARRGVKVGLGLDGGTNDSSDFYALMKTAVGLQRVRATDAGVFPQVADVLRMATLGGAEALGIADRVGSLTPGKRADVVVVDPAALNFAPRFDWVGQLVFNGRPENVDAVFVDGRALKLDGRLVGIDTDRVVRDAEAAAARLRRS
ncbi:amidohydrolase family protein [Streptomyces sp. NRRL F-2664]|uniref:amidohydrolase family protein n=1 Tax=Streptomyces sp. NRRL F-2664 TaxID=1463842 RepID=UPI000AD17518|nr:amidohydrolase family protein [Streptomyces sp. NRRL F-2664]